MVVIAGVIIGSVVLFLPGSKPPTKQQRVNQLAVKAGCPSSPYAEVDKTLSWKHPPAQTLDRRGIYDATFTTTAGTFVVQLDPKTAPVNVNNFVFLAEHHYYNCTVFDRVLTGFMDQGGGPYGGPQDKNPSASDLPQGPGYSIKQDEYPTPPKHGDLYAAGTVAMANSGPGTNGSQFFIMAANYTSATVCRTTSCLPPQYTIIGHVISGLGVVKAINEEGGPAASSTSAGGVPPKVINRVLSVVITR